jgi:hypothetical protein
MAGPEGERPHFERTPQQPRQPDQTQQSNRIRHRLSKAVVWMAEKAGWLNQVDGQLVQAYLKSEHGGSDRNIRRGQAPESKTTEGEGDPKI